MLYLSSFIKCFFIQILIINRVCIYLLSYANPVHIHMPNSKVKFTILFEPLQPIPPPPSNLPDLEGVISQKRTLMDPCLGQKDCRRVAPLQRGGATFDSLLIAVNVMTPINYIHLYNQPK